MRVMGNLSRPSRCHSSVAAEFAAHFTTGSAKWVLLALFAVSSCPRATSQSPAVSFDPANDGQVTFEVIPNSNPEPPPPDEILQDFYSGTTTGNEFTLYVDPSTIVSKGKYTSYVSFEARLKNNQGATSWSVFTVIAKSPGSFPDSFQKVSFKVRGAGPEANGSLELPVHSANYKSALQWVGDGTPPVLVVKLSGSGGPTIPFKNTLDRLPVKVQKIDVTGFNCQDCWQLLDESHKNINLTIDPDKEVRVPLNVVPRSLRAVMTTLGALRSDQSQDTLLVRLSYSADLGGRTVTPEFEVPVRFTPTIWALVIFVLIGGTVGTVVDVAKNKQKVTKGFIGAKAGYVLLAEIIALILVLAKTKVQVFGLELDPRQVLSAAIIAFATAGGAAAVAVVTDIIKIWRGTSTPTGGGAPIGGDHD